MRETQQKSRDAQVPAVVEQGKEAAIQSCQWSDAKYYVEQQKCASSERSDQQCLRRRRRIQPGAYAHEKCQVKSQKREKHSVIDFLLPVPADGPLLNAHGSFSTGAASTTTW